MGAGVLLTYNDSTVDATSFTAPSAITRPSASPARPPAIPKQAASPRNAPSTWPRVAPKARRTPISFLRRTTETEMVL